MADPRRIETTCCIVGGGPAGMVCGLILARAGVKAVVLEKHSDFLRDFRGDTVHPSTLDVIDELGLMPDFLTRPHTRVTELTGVIGGEPIRIADFTHVSARNKFLALMPQWHFLDMFADAGAKLSTFDLHMNAKGSELVIENGVVRGVRASTLEGPLDIRADLVIAADGRTSDMRAQSGLSVRDLGAPMDVLWMRIEKAAGHPDATAGYFDAGRILVLLDRGEYWQAAFVIPKGADATLRARGLEALRADIAAIAPFLTDALEKLASLDDVKLLTVTVDRMERWWRPGLLCIGDCAHAMSPIGGVGINLAVQDAVAAANILAEPLRTGRLQDRHLQAVQRRRLFPTRVVQVMQVTAQRRVIAPVLSARGRTRPPGLVRLLSRWRVLQRLPAQFIGVGVRPEHVRAPAAKGISK